jgi:hypothetical protein
MPTMTPTRGGGDLRVGIKGFVFACKLRGHESEAADYRQARQGRKLFRRTR